MNLGEMMRYKTYEKYVDSNIEGVGRIPSHWELKKLKYNCKVNPSKKQSISNEDLKINFLPMEKVSEDGWYDIESFAPYSSISKGYTYFEDNDVLLAKITPCFENGKSTVVKDLKYGFGFGSTEFHVLRFRKNILPKFIYYVIKSYAFRTIGQAFMNGTAGQKRVGVEFIENYLMVTPPLYEQEQVVNYLDTQTSKIDENIAKNEELIQLLEEKRVALINQVVTKGLDHNAQMKESRIKWIRKIPKHWTETKLKYISTRISKRAKKEDEMLVCSNSGKVILDSFICAL